MGKLEKIGFGGGCHWCTEAVFQQVPGVVRVEQGYLGAVAPDSEFSEGVIVHYDAGEVGLEQLFLIHLSTHKSTSAHSFREKYRSAVYCFGAWQEEAFAKAKKRFQPRFEKPIITRGLPFSKFKASRESIRDYYRKNPESPFCTRYIVPKLETLSRLDCSFG